VREGAKGNLPPANVKLGERHYIGKGAFVDACKVSRGAYFHSLLDCIQNTQATGPVWDESIPLEAALERLADILRAAHKAGGKAIFIGNGGSAAIASHMAVDYSKNKGVRAVALNDAAMLTMLANDYGYEQVFAKQLEYHGRKADVAVIVSSSGRSLNIIAAADAARECELRNVATFSGMNPHNKLRVKGDLNFYVPCTDYGLVELAHLALLHSVASV
jgi:D-sedoheptulose 7-phosphate isomerase